MIDEHMTPEGVMALLNQRERNLQRDGWVESVKLVGQMKDLLRQVSIRQGILSDCQLCDNFIREQVEYYFSSMTMITKYCTIVPTLVQSWQKHNSTLSQQTRLILQDLDNHLEVLKSETSVLQTNLSNPSYPCSLSGHLIRMRFSSERATMLFQLMVRIFARCCLPEDVLHEPQPPHVEMYDTSCDMMVEPVEVDPPPLGRPWKPRKLAQR
jgi:hypothetical protein